MLNIKWGHRSDVSGKGTFKEQWRLQWDPAFSIDIIEKGSFGNTIEEAATKYVIHLSEKARVLPEVCRLLENAIPAELPMAVESLVHKVNNLAATSNDVIQLMEVIPGLVNASRYGSVRKTDTELLTNIVDSMITRVCISLPSACTNINDDAAEHLLELFTKMNDAVNVLQQNETTTQWQQTLTIVSNGKSTAPVLGGYNTRLLVDHKLIVGEELVKAFYYAMSAATGPGIAASWLEGFLKGGGTILLIDNDLWNVVNNWVEQLEENLFVQVLPLLRRTFAEFSKPERRRLGEKVRSGAGGVNVVQKTSTDIDHERAKQGIDVVLRLLGYKIDDNNNKA